MKPKYIFSAVFAVCLIMGGLLPRLSRGSHASAAPAVQAAPAAQAAAMALPITPTQTPAALPATAAPPAAQAAVLPTLAPIVQPDLAAPPGTEARPTVDPAAGVPLTANLPDLAAFTASVAGGPPDQLTGVYVPDQFALPVVQQPAGDDEFVSDSDGTVTQYNRPASYGAIGLLAHNTLSGAFFFQLKDGQEVVLVYGGGRQARYRISAVQRYQALNPTDTHSDFVDLNGPGAQVLNYQDLFQRVYTQANQLVFQTCFEANGDPSWGRVFYIANPI